MAPLSRQRLYTKLSNYTQLYSAIASGTKDTGSWVQRLEEELSETTGTHALCTIRARVALYVGLQTLFETTTRREVLLSPYTIFDVVNMVIAAGGTPVFVDTELQTCNISADAVERRISSSTAAVLVTHLHGLASDVKRIRALCDVHGAAMVEDAAQSVGTMVDGQDVGSFGDMSAYSFGMMKNINAFNGGMLLIKDPEMAESARRKLSSFPVVGTKDLLMRSAYGVVLDVATAPLVFKMATYWAFKYGYLYDVGAINSISKSERNPVLRAQVPDNYKQGFSQIQAKIVLDQLPTIKAFGQQRIAHAMRYFDGLQDIQELQLPPRHEDGSHTYMSFPIQTSRRDELIAHLFRNGRDCAAQHLRNCAELDAFSEYASPCPNAQQTSGNTILLPTYPRYSIAEIDENITAIRDFFQPK